MLQNTFLLAFIANVPFPLEVQSYQPVSVAFCNANATTDVDVDTDVTNWSNFNFSSIDIVRDIQSFRFLEADNKIIEMGVSSPGIATIIQAVYNNNSNNFYFINDFGKAALQRSVRCSVLVELWNLMNLHGDMDVFKLIELYRSLSVHVIGNTTSQEVIVTKLRDVDVSNAIIRNAKALIDGNYQQSISIQKLFTELFKYKFSDDLIRKVIDEVYNKIPTEELIKVMYNEKQKRQSAAALLYISKKLSAERMQRSNDRANQVMAQSLKRLKQLSDFNLDTAFVDQAISKLPHSLKNLFFTDKVTFFNVGYEEYIYSPADDVIMLPSRRYVLSVDLQYPGIRTSWIAKQYVDEDFSFEFVSEYNKNEYMYAYDKKVAMLWPYSIVLTSGGSTGKQSAWQIYPIGDYVFIKNLHNKGYLCLSDILMEDEGRYILTKKNRKKPELLECQWKISTF